MPEPNQEERNFHVQCARYDDEEADYLDETDAVDDGWVKDSDGNWYSPAAMDNGCICHECGCYINFDNDDYICNVDGDDETYHRDCANDAYWCERCESWHWQNNVDEVRVMIHRGNDSPYEEYWCENCACNDACWDDDDECYHYFINGRQDAVYSDIHKYPTGTKMETCPDCIAAGLAKGQCEKCLRAQAFNKELCETTLWVYDTSASTAGFYHPAQHVDFKKMFYRDKHEHPHLYYGIEVEVSFEIKNMEPRIADVAGEFIRLTKGLFVAESDSSLQNGIEFISRPTSYKMWTKPETIKMLKEAFAYLKSKGAYIDQPKRNGIHIHMSRKFFERNTQKSPEQINKDLDWVFQYYQPEIEQISQREYTRYCYSKVDDIRNYFASSRVANTDRFKNITISGELEPTSIVDGQLEHHAVIAMRNQTIEVRCFKSSIDVDTIISYIEFVRNIAHTVRNKDIKKMSLNDILASKNSPMLDNYIWKLRKKGLNTDKKVKPVIKYKIDQKQLKEALTAPF